MKIDLSNPLSIDWKNITSETASGTTGQVEIKLIDVGDIRIRLADYSAGYLADHWCVKGHIVQVLEGQLILEHEDGNSLILTSGMTYIVGDDRQPHRAKTKSGAKVFIVD